MRIDEAVLERLRDLPAEMQQEVLNFAESLQQKAEPMQPLTSLKGLCADLNLELTDEEIAAARREMSGELPPGRSLMGSVVADTHAFVWYVLASSRLSAAALAALEDAVAAGHPVYLPAVSLVEICYLVERGRLPEEVFERTIRALDDPSAGVLVAPLDRGVAEAILRIPRLVVPELPDRIIAATALHLGLPPVTRDHRIQRAPVQIIW